jgi:hypothetical protein
MNTSSLVLLFLTGKIKMRENLIENFLDNFDVNTKAYNVLLFLLGVLIVMTLYVNHKIRTEREIGFIQKMESTTIPLN